MGRSLHILLVRFFCLLTGFVQFHIGCLSMSEPPQGEYICEACQLRRDKQNRKPGKRKGMNGGGRGRGV
jgi:hypothetical protein